MFNLMNISKKYNEDIILDEVSYSFKDKGFYSILGESGSGKSTLLNILGLIETPSEGKIYFKSERIDDLNDSKRREFRRQNLGFIFQSFNLFDDTTVFNNLELLLNTTKKEVRENKETIIDSVLNKLDILKLKYSLVKDLSGGEKQRVAIARTLITKSKVILADEPSGALDEENGNQIFKILKELSKNTLVIVVTHNEELAKKYSDIIVRIENKKLKEYENFEIELLKKEEVNKNSDKNNKNSKEKTSKKDELKIKFSFKWNHYKTLFKSKKIRMLATISLFSISLLVSGLTIFLKDGLESLLLSSFEGIIGENSLILKRKEDDSAILSYYSASKNDVETLMKNHSENIDYIGCSYLNNLEDYFPDQNVVELNFPYHSPLTLKDYKATVFNEFRYVESFKGRSDCYPKINEKLNSNEVVIGLNNDDMLEITKHLNIEATFSSLGEYIKNYNPYIIMYLKNNYWTYEDEVLLEVKGFIPSRDRVVYSSNYLFNEYLFEEYMRFPSSNNIEKEEEYPWTLKKVYYIHTVDEPSDFINSLIKEVEYRNYIFDSDKSYYHSTYEENEDSNRIYCYQSLKKTIDLSIVESLSKNDNFKNYYYGTDGGYVNFGSILAGFYRPTFFSFNHERLNLLIDECKNLTYEEYYSLDVEGNVLEGNYLKQNSNTVRFNPKMNEKIEGNYPSNNKEIAVSKGFINQLNLSSPMGKELYLLSINSIIEKNDTLFPDFKMISLKISGVVDSNKVEIYHSNDFSLTLFRDLFKMSAFELNINSVTFLLNERISNEELNKLNENLNTHEFVYPLNDIQKSLDETLNYVQLFMIIFAIISIIASLILFSIINYIQFLEYKKDIAILSLIGFSKIEIIRYCFFNNFVNGFFSLIMSSLSLVFIGIILSRIITSMFGIPTLPFFSISPFMLMLGIVLLLNFLSLTLIISPIKRVDIKKEIHKI